MVVQKAIRLQQKAQGEDLEKRASDLPINDEYEGQVADVNEDIKVAAGICITGAPVYAKGCHETTKMGLIVHPYISITNGCDSGSSIGPSQSVSPTL